jgi:adenine deaminase
LSHDTLENVVKQLDEAETAAGNLGNLPPASFAILSFLALPVIPELRVTDRGIFDVMAFKLIS